MDQPLRAVLAQPTRSHQGTGRTPLARMPPSQEDIMTAVDTALDHLSLSITEEIHVRASLAATFAALLEEMGPSSEGHNGAPMPMVLEPWPGGRWYRDLGDHNGHLWGHVQAIKPPTLLEI